MRRLLCTVVNFAEYGYENQNVLRVEERLNKQLQWLPLESLRVQAFIQCWPMRRDASK